MSEAAVVSKKATFETNRGTIVAELYDKEAPGTVGNFEKLANEGFYDGVKFHRVIPSFVVQGGDPLSRDLPAGNPKIGTGGPGWHIKCETKGNPHTHKVGALSMAHAGKDTGGSQFFMVLDENATRRFAAGRRKRRSLCARLLFNSQFPTPKPSRELEAT